MLVAGYLVSLDVCMTLRVKDDVGVVLCLRCYLVWLGDLWLCAAWVGCLDLVCELFGLDVGLLEWFGYCLIWCL